MIQTLSLSLSLSRVNSGVELALLHDDPTQQRIRRIVVFILSAISTTGATKQLYLPTES
jgi:hypothetical protein